MKYNFLISVNSSNTLFVFFNLDFLKLSDQRLISELLFVVTGNPNLENAFLVPIEIKSIVYWITSIKAVMSLNFLPLSFFKMRNFFHFILVQLECKVALF